MVGRFFDKNVPAQVPLPRLRRPAAAPDIGVMFHDHERPLATDTDSTSRRLRMGARRRTRSAAVQSDDDLAAWLVEIVAICSSCRRPPAELADWLQAAVPRRHWPALGHLWCAMNGLTATKPGVIRLAGPMTLEQARHVLWAVRRRARGVVSDEMAAQTARRRREVPIGDLRGDVG